MSKTVIARHLYSVIASEFGVPEFAVRKICGIVGNKSGMITAERLSLMRAKMEIAGFGPVRGSDRQQDNKDEVDHDHEREPLRSCTWCQEFLDDDDEGESLVHSDEQIAGVLCRKCVKGMIRY